MFSAILIMAMMSQSKVVLFPTIQDSLQYIRPPIASEQCSGLEVAEANDMVAGITFFAGAIGGAATALVGGILYGSSTRYQINGALTGTIVGSLIGSLLRFIPSAIYTPCYAGKR